MFNKSDIYQIEYLTVLLIPLSMELAHNCIFPETASKDTIETETYRLQKHWFIHPKVNKY